MIENILNAKKPTVIELFAGAGGMALGLEKAGFETKLLVEYDKDCVATLQKNRPKWNVMHDDIHNIDFKGMKADVESEILDLVDGTNNFSVEGKIITQNTWTTIEKEFKSEY